MENLQGIINEYPLDYCELLEDVYGKGLMSEGGTKAIDDLFKEVNLEQKNILDVGSGLGGLSLYLAEKYHCTITGLEINPSLVIEANQRIPKNFRHKVFFKLYNNINSLPFETSSFDIIVSKGSLVHVKNKLELFKEFSRILKSNCKLVINDWLSTEDDKWCPQIKKMCDLENLTLYAVSKRKYIQTLNASELSVINIENCSLNYSQYNAELALSLNKNKDFYIRKYGVKTWQEAIEGYDLISESQRNQDLKVYNFYCENNK